MRRLTPLLIAVVLAAVAIAACSDGSSTLQTVSPDDAEAIIAENPDVVVLDIRTPDEVAEGALEGAVNIDFYESDFADQLDALDRGADYVVYCRSGNRSGQAMDVFAELGFESVTEIDGGIVAWYQAGLPVDFS